MLVFYSIHLAFSFGISNENTESEFSTQSMIPIEKWSFLTGGRTSYYPCVFDVNEDGKFEVIIGSEDHFLYCFDYLGNIIWSFEACGRVFSAPCIADINQDGVFEILFGAGYNPSKMYCLAVNGTEIWSFYSGNYGISSPGAADIDNDGTFEIIFGTSWPAGVIYCLDHLGYQEWNYSVIDGAGRGPSFANLDSDSYLEIIMGTSTDDKVLCFNHDGTVNWYFQPGRTCTTRAAIVDLTNDGDKEIIIGCRDDKLYCLNQLGEVEWSYTTDHYIDSSAAIGDIDNDGELEIVFGSDDDNLYCLYNNGSKKWSKKTYDSVSASPVLGDLNNDGFLEVIFGSQDDKLYCISHTGSKIWDLPYRLVRSSCLIIDLDRDGIVEIIFGAEDTVYCLTISDVSSSGKSSWYCSGGSIFRTGHMDEDGDYLDSFSEERYFGTIPSIWDTDHDKFGDGEEILLHKTNPLKSRNHPFLWNNWLPITAITVVGLGSSISIIFGIRISILKRKKKYAKVIYEF